MIVFRKILLDITTEETTILKHNVTIWLLLNGFGNGGL